MDFPKLLGKRIKELRNNAGLSQDQAAERAGISGKYLGQVERGEVNVSAIIIYKLSSVFDVSINDFYEFEHHNDVSLLRDKIISFINSTSDKNIRNIYNIIISLHH